MTRRPNILLLMTDQQSANALSCAGNDEMSTPALDALAASGVRFGRAYCPYPLCTPARASLFTGLMPHQAGIMTNGVALNEQARGHELGKLLAEAGYDCAYGGKWHVPETTIPETHGFRRICGFNDAHLADCAIDFLRQQRDQPFFLVASFDNPHNICEWARCKVLPWGPIPDVPTEQCPNLPANFAIAPFEPDVLRLSQRADPRVYPTVLYTDSEWRHYRHAYYRLVEKVDAQIGRILQALRQLRLEEDTLIVFTSDHGDGQGAHHWNQKTVLYEEIVRVPLLLSWRGVTAAGIVDEAHVVSNGLDLLPTLCDYAGVATPPGLPGLSLRPLAEGRGVESWRETAPVETELEIGQWRAGGRMVVGQRYKYVVYEWGRYREQLYDLQRDPGEMVNLAVEARYADLLADYRARLYAWCLESGDSFGAAGTHPGAISLPGYEFEPF